MSALLDRADLATKASAVLIAAMKDAVAAQVAPSGKVDRKLLDQHQLIAHGLSWATTYHMGLVELLAWGRTLETEGAFGPLEQAIIRAGFGEYLAELASGIPISQGEIVRPAMMGVPAAQIRAFRKDEAVTALIDDGTNPAIRQEIADLIAAANGENFGHVVLDETLGMVRDQFRRFADEKVIPHAHGWHLRDELIPMDVLEEMGALGVFGLTLPESHGGAGLGKTAMCIVSEELSRGYIGVGSLGTRTEIAGELILAGGTEAQKEKYLARIAAAEIIPTAVFTEPDIGSDLANLTTRAEKVEGGYKITGAKNWITHAARADMMTLLARTGEPGSGHNGLSMFLVEKPRGTENDPFPLEGMSGSEIPVIGYRGMKEYALSFDGVFVPDEALLGGVEGQGFRQLMKTFESARIQTAARATGVAQSALEIALEYAMERKQFGQPLFAFPRVSGKIAWMVVETMIVRCLTLFAAREKDSGRRCDLEAGMAKLLAARVAWANADNAVQIHGGNGFAMEYPVSRVLCDARILSIFEGAAEIQAQVIARRLLES